jgi:hypothetical protein
MLELLRIQQRVEEVQHHQRGNNEHYDGFHTRTHLADVLAKVNVANGQREEGDGDGGHDEIVH